MSKVNYSNVTMTMANTFELAGCPLSPEQHIILAGCIAVYGEKWISDERERAAKVCEETDTAHDIAQVWIEVAATRIRNYPNQDKSG